MDRNKTLKAMKDKIDRSVFEYECYDKMTLVAPPPSQFTSQPRMGHFSDYMEMQAVYTLPYHHGDVHMESHEAVLAALDVGFIPYRFQRKPLHLIEDQGRTYIETDRHLDELMGRNFNVNHKPLGSHYFEGTMIISGGTVKVISLQMICVYTTNWVFKDQPVHLRISIKGKPSHFEISAARSGDNLFFVKDGWQSIELDGNYALYYPLSA